MDLISQNTAPEWAEKKSLPCLKSLTDFALRFIESLVYSDRSMLI